MCSISSHQHPGGDHQAHRADEPVHRQGGRVREDDAVGSRFRVSGFELSGAGLKRKERPEAIGLYVSCFTFHASPSLATALVSPKNVTYNTIACPRRASLVWRRQ